MALNSFAMSTEVDGIVNQDRTATYIFHFLNSLVLGLGCLLWQPSGWMLCLLLVSLVYHLNVGYILLQDENKQKMVYVPAGRPLQNAITIASLGICFMLSWQHEVCGCLTYAACRYPATHSVPPDEYLVLAPHRWALGHGRL